jgi:signal transduction histidine kinase
MNFLTENSELPDRVASYLRIGVVTRFLAIIGVLIGIQLPGMRPFSLSYFFVLAVIESVANLFYLLVGYKRWPRQAFHVTGLIDAVALGGLIYLSGGSHSPFSALFLLVIVFNGIFYGWPGLVSGAIPSMILFTLGSILAPEPVSWSTIVVKLSAWAALAFLSGIAGEREKENRNALIEGAAQLSAIYETSTNISNHVEAEGLIGTATHRTHEWAKHMWGPDVVTAITTLDSEIHEMTIVYLEGSESELHIKRFPMTMLPETLHERLMKKKPIFVGVDRFQELRRIFRLPDDATILLGPICEGSELLGVLSVRSIFGTVPSESQMEVIETIANHLATALFRVKQLEDERRRRGEAHALFEMARDLRAITDLESLLQHISRRSLSILGLDACAVGLLTEDGSAVALKAWAVAADQEQPSSEDISALGPVPIEYLREALEEQRPMELPSMEDQPEINQRISALLGAKSAAVLPIIIRDEVAGAIGFGHRDEGTRFSIRQLQVAEAIANLAAVAIDNVRLYELDMQSAREHAALFDVAKLITESLDPHEVSEKVAYESIAATGAASATIFLTREDRLVPQNPGAEGTSPAFALPRALLMDQSIKAFIQSGRVTLFTNIDKSPLKGSWPPDSTLGPHCLAPLNMRELPLGLLLLEVHEGWKTQSSGNLIEGIASLASAALDNALRFEAEREAVEQLKELDRLKTEAVSTASHELRSPLTSISGFARTLLRPGANFSEDEKREFLQVIDHQAKQLARLIDELLTVSRIEEGGMPLTLRPVDLKTLASELIAAAKGRTSIHEFETQFGDEFPPVVADEGRLTEIVGNLVDNAIKYSPGGGKITIGGDVQRGEVHISIKDEGVGIDPDELENVFGKFYQVHGRPEAAGTGLGLYIVQELVAAHDGKIWVESEKGKGTTFHVALPQRRATDRLAAERGAVERS